MTMEQNIPITCQKDFNSFREAHKDRLAEYVKAFYAERDFLIHHEKELWLSLNPLFDDVAEAFTQRASFEGLQILTTKRRDDVLEIFEYWEIPFPADQISYMNAAGKSEKLLQILHENHAMMGESVYFEDQVDFLVESQKHGIGSYLVEWGYVSEEQQALARQHQIPIITMQTFREILSNF
jgi:phosphoglycolate phosphatase-like HAD superfamily hydrolase